MRGDRAEQDEGRSRRGGVEEEEAVNECLSVAAQGQMSGDCDSSRARTAKWPARDRRGDRGRIAEDVLAGRGGKQRGEHVSSQSGDCFCRQPQ